MDSDETDIVDFLRTCGEQYVGAREICRRAGTKKKYREDPDWAVRVLPLMVEKRILESDGMAHYKLAPEKKKEKKRWVAPEIQKILDESGKEFEEPTDPGAPPPPPEKPL
jgi:hypothetical protein